jgi:hypothetical protein
VNKVILNWQRSLWEGEWEVVKSGRDETNVDCNTHVHGSNTKNLSV